MFLGTDAVGIKRRMAAHELAERGEGDDGASAPAAGDAASSSSGMPRGGIKRRMQESSPTETAASGSGTEGPLWRRLVKKWAQGELSSAEVQKMAMASEGQGAFGMNDLAKIGNYGANPQNCFRAMKNLLGLPDGAPSFTFFEIPTIHGPTTPHPFLLPHEFFASQFAQQREAWTSAIAGPPNAALDVWRSMRGTDFMKAHPNLARRTWSNTIPLGMHGDGAAFSHQDSVYTFSWNSLVGTGQTIAKRFVATFMKKSDMVEGTVDAISRVLAWSFNILLSGTTPNEDWTGAPLEGGGHALAGGWRGALCQARGDWAYYCEFFKFPQWNCADRMCWLCGASSVDPAMAWTTFSDAAGWRKKRWSHDGYLAFLRRCGLAIPPMLVAAIGFRLECVMIDVLHTVDLGVASHVIANVMFLFAVMRSVFGGGTQEKKIEKLMAHMQSWYSSNKPSSNVKGKLTVERIRTRGGWPKLKAKAAATRHLAGYALALVQEFGTPDDRRVLAVCQLLVKFYAFLDSESQFMGPVAKAEMPKLGRQLVGIYSSLAQDAVNARVKMWKLMPKLHLFLHLCEWQSVELGNPRYYWTYPDEDLAGLMAQVATSCHPRTMHTAALFKWLHLTFG